MCILKYMELQVLIFTHVILLLSFSRLPLLFSADYDQALVLCKISGPVFVHKVLISRNYISHTYLLNVVTVCPIYVMYHLIYDLNVVNYVNPSKLSQVPQVSIWFVGRQGAISFQKNLMYSTACMGCYTMQRNGHESYKIISPRSNCVFLTGKSLQACLLNQKTKPQVNRKHKDADCQGIAGGTLRMKMCKMFLLARSLKCKACYTSWPLSQESRQLS